MRKRYSLIILSLLVLSAGCRQNNYRVKIDNTERVVDIVRVERELFDGDPAGLGGRLSELKRGHQACMSLLGYVLNAGEITGSNWDSIITNFVTDREIVEVYRNVIMAYPDIDMLEDDLNRAWLHWRYYFPDYEVPSVYTCITGFNNSIIVGDSVIGIGLDRYLGADSKYYPMLGIYKYMAARMKPENIVTDCMYGWASATWEPESIARGEASLLENMIYYGKLFYFTKCMVPAGQDSTLFGFTGLQMKFCNNNEQQMWEYIIEHDLLFSTDPMTITKLTGEAPFTAWFTSESPGRAASWIGFRIVESYMKRNPSTSLEQLMDYNDAQQILELSKYSPG